MKNSFSPGGRLLLITALPVVHSTSASHAVSKHRVIDFKKFVNEIFLILCQNTISRIQLIVLTLFLKELFMSTTFNDLTILQQVHFVCQHSGCQTM